MDIVPQNTHTTKYSAAESFDLLWNMVKQPGAVVEVRALLKTSSEWRRAWTGFGSTITGYFDDPDAFAESLAALEASGRATSIYVTLNPVKEDLAARSYNRLIAAKSGETTSDDQIVRRCWLLIDCDPIRPSGISATDEELAAAIERANEIAKYLHDLGWPIPVGARSGNGIHLLYRIDLPNSPEARDLVSNVLNSLQLQFGDTEAPGVGLDTSVYNAARITKAYGTTARKGDDLPGRPHRLSYIESTPWELDSVAPSQLQDLAAIWTSYQAALKAEQKAEREAKRTGRPGDDVIAIFNEQNPIEETLAKYGYAQTKRANRWKRPDGASGSVLVDKTANKAYANSANDPMKNGHRFDPFDLFTQYEHGGDRKEAYKAAKKALGLWEENTDDPYKQLTNLKPHVNGASKEVATAPAQPAESGNFLLWEKWDDEGNAQCVHRLFPGQFLHSKELGWLHHTGTHWTATGAGATLDRAIVAMLRARRHEAVDADNEKMIKAMAASQGRKNGAKDLFSSIVDCRHDRFNANPWLLNVQNGTIDLRTGDLRPHCKDDLITKMAPVDYDLVAKCPRWLAFLDRIFAGDKDLIAFVQRAVGYSLTAATTEHKLFFAYGGGNNGKSTFFEALAAILGDYWQKAPTEMIMIRKFTGIPNDIARMFGARMVVCAEVEEGQQLAESKVKDLTGGDTLTARFLNKEFFDFKPTHKLWLYGNHKPVITGTDHGVWRRINLIPFLVTIPKEEINPKLGELLMQEAAGILSWAVAGCLDWQRSGLNPPAAVLDATKEYRNESDLIGAFLQECTITGEWARARAGQLYKAYCAWCEQGGEKVVTNTRFGRSMVERGYKKSTAGGGFVTYEGIGLRENDDDS